MRRTSLSYQQIQVTQPLIFTDKIDSAQINIHKVRTLFIASVAAYSSGNVILRISIDGLSLACDIGLDLYDYSISGDKEALVENLLNTVVSNAIGIVAAKGISGNITEKVLREQMEPIIEDIVSSGYTTLTEIMKKISED